MTIALTFPTVAKLHKATLQLGLLTDSQLTDSQYSEATRTDLPALKKRYGKNMVFCGGIDSHHILPFGTAAEVRAEVKRVIEILGPGGGCMIGPVHTVMNHVPPENVLAMVDAVEEFGHYPLKT